MNSSAAVMSENDEDDSQKSKKDVSPYFYRLSVNLMQLE